MRRKWWGWGDPNKVDELESHPTLYSFLKSQLNLSGSESYPTARAEDIKLPESKLTKDLMAELIRVTAPENVCGGDIARLIHSAGLGYKDIIRLRRGLLPDYVDAVVYPVDERQVVKVLKVCEENYIEVLPYGGGSSVVGSFEVIRDRGSGGVIAVDMTVMGRLMKLDATSGLDTFEAGVSGPDIEAQLAPHGFTLGHFPQSFEYSTLGGWIATRSAGSSSDIYGKIEDMVVSLRVATPKGIVETKTVPKSAAGPDLRQLFLGSEGTMGIITQATMVVRRVPQAKAYSSFLFKSFDRGIEALRQLVQSRVKGSTLRLSDERETWAFYNSAGEAVSTSSKLKQEVGKWYVAKRGFSFEDGSLLMAITQGGPNEIDGERKFIADVCHAHGGISLGSSPAEAWLESRFDQPYLRDSMISHGIMVDTLETATVWSNVRRLHDAVAVAITTELERRGFSSLVTCHLSHSYPSGSSLYFTFMSRQQEGKELDQWEAVKYAATSAIVENGGTISHHHGVGLEHSRWMVAEDGEQGVAALKALKAALDPKGILNPGKLLPRKEARTP